MTRHSAFQDTWHTYQLSELMSVSIAENVMRTVIGPAAFWSRHDDDITGPQNQSYWFNISCFATYKEYRSVS